MPVSLAPRTRPDIYIIQASAIVKGLGTALIWQIGLTFVLSTLYYMMSFNTELMNSLLLVITGFSAIAGGLTAARQARFRGWLHGGLAGLALAAFAWTIQAAGIVGTNPTLISTVYACLAAAILGGIGGIIGMTISD